MIKCLQDVNSKKKKVYLVLRYSVPANHSTNQVPSSPWPLFSKRGESSLSSFHGQWLEGLFYNSFNHKSGLATQPPLRINSASTLWLSSIHRERRS